MTLLLSASAVTFAAFCIWLAVRIFNRRERWAKRTGVAVLLLPVLYVLSFGPACWWLARPAPQLFWGEPGGSVPTIESAFPHAPLYYWPLGWLAQYGRQPIAPVLQWYATAGNPNVVIPTSHRGDLWFDP